MKKKFFFGRTQSRKISKFKQTNFKKFIAGNNIDKLNLRKNLLLEIGIGMGENLIYLSKKYKKKTIVGVDPFKNGMFNVSDYCMKNKIKNIYLYPHVIEKFFRRFKKLRFSDVYILFPDPWPKKRHSKRRIINENFIKKILSIMKSRGKVFFSTDNNDYFSDVKTLLKRIDGVKVKKINKIITIKTKYFRKAENKGNKINSLIISKS